MIYLRLFWVFCRIGAVTFGGGYAMISLIQSEVASQGWCTAAQFADMVAVSQMTPGPISLNTATYVGKIVAGVPGALAATSGLVFPTVILASLASVFLDKLKRSRVAEPFIRGVRAAAIGLIASAVLFFIESSVISGELPLNFRTWGAAAFEQIRLCWQGLAIFSVLLAAIIRFRLKPHWTILISGAAGIILYGLWPAVC